MLKSTYYSHLFIAFDRKGRVLSSRNQAMKPRKCLQFSKMVGRAKASEHQDTLVDPCPSDDRITKEENLSHDIDQKLVYDLAKSSLLGQVEV